MKNSFSNPLSWFGIGLIFVIAVNFIVSRFDRAGEKLNVAYESYRKAEQAQNLAEREDGFNLSLKNYSELEKEYSPVYGNGKLYYNIANNYFQLGQYPYAVLYYLKAMKLMPRNEDVKTNLSITYNKLGIKNEKEDSFFDHLFFFHQQLSLPEKLQLLFVLTLILFVLASLQIWKNFKGLKTLIVITAFMFVSLLFSLFYAQYISPSFGVIVKANELYQDAGLQYSKVLDMPISPGTKVKVLDIMNHGKWIKIETEEGDVGYIPYESMQII